MSAVDPVPVQEALLPDPSGVSDAPVVEMTCGGQRVDIRTLRPSGRPCGRRYVGVAASARVAGWVVLELAEGGVTVMCPRCAAPDGARVG